MPIQRNIILQSIILLLVLGCTNKESIKSQYEYNKDSAINAVSTVINVDTEEFAIPFNEHINKNFTPYSVNYKGRIFTITQLDTNLQVIKKI